MNEQQFEAKMEKDGNRVKRAVDQMAGDGASHLKNEFDDFSDAVKDNVNNAAKTIKKDVHLGMKHYNSKAQEVADRLPYGLSQNVTKYPWVVISLGLVFGLILGFMLKPSQRYQ